MSNWVKSTVMLMIVGTWSIFILVSLIRADKIETYVWGLPGAIFAVTIPFWLRSEQKEPPKRPQQQPRRRS